MSATAWAEYLDDYEAYLTTARRGLREGRQAPADQRVERPNGPVPEEYAWKVLQLVAEATSTLDGERAGSPPLFSTCRTAARRILGRARRGQAANL